MIREEGFGDGDGGLLLRTGVRSYMGRDSVIICHLLLLVFLWLFFWEGTGLEFVYIQSVWC